MPSDTSEKGLETLIMRHMAGVDEVKHRPFHAKRVQASTPLTNRRRGMRAGVQPVQASLLWLFFLAPGGITGGAMRRKGGKLTFASTMGALARSVSCLTSPVPGTRRHAEGKLTFASTMTMGRA
jgi:hypothetical protein